MEKVDEILQIFEGHRMAPTPLDQYEQVGKNVLRKKLSSFMEHESPIDFVMLGFPAKSPNERDKVIGPIPDLGEEATIHNFVNFAQKVKEVYSPGININLVSDGYVFSDIMKISNITVAGYEEVMLDMIKDSSSITWYNMTDFWSKRMSMTTVREKLMSNFGVTPEVLKQRILVDPDVNFLYRGMIRFLELDLSMYNYNSNSQLHKDAKRVALEMMYRNEAYSHLVKDEFKDSIRLSMHPSINNGNKYSFQLIPSPKAWTSPWHCAILKHEGGILETIHRKDASGYQLIFKDGRPHHYEFY